MPHKTCTTVSLLKRPIKNGKLTLYLDFYPPVRNPETMKLTRREFLGIYIFAKPKTVAEREYNADMMAKAEAIRNIRFNALLNEQFGFLDHEKLKMDFLAYFEGFAKKKRDKWMSAYLHFKNFVKGKCRFGDINQTLCEKFATYLLVEAKDLKHGKRHLANNSAAAFFCTFRALLKQAYKAKYLQENINDYIESIPLQKVKKPSLTLEQAKALVATPCKHEVLKRVALFGILTGLRISDIEKLRWENIVPSISGGWQLDIVTQKTGTPAILPLNEEALELCGEQGEGLVFKGFRRSMTQHPFKQWLRDAGITKPFTFHGFRHTFAGLQIYEGTDIYTLRDLMTHSSVKTTEIYLDQLTPRATEAINKLSLK